MNVILFKQIIAISSLKHVTCCMTITIQKNMRSIYGPVAEKWDLRKYANICEQRISSPACASAQSGQDLRCSVTQYRGPVEDIGHSKDLDPTHGCANWSWAFPFVYDLRAFLLADGSYALFTRGMRCSLFEIFKAERLPLQWVMCTIVQLLL